MIYARLFGLLALLAVATPCLAADPPSTEDVTVRCKNGAVVTVNTDASAAGVATLQQGGNAIDSAVATAFALAVTHPAAGNIGGGGFMLVAPAEGEPIFFDFREVAPAAATREMFVKPADRTPHRRVGVPGTVRGLALAHVRMGKLPWRDLLAPAIKLANEGFALDAATARSLNGLLASSDKTQFAELHRVFAPTNGNQWRAGDRLVQPDLGRTLQRIADFGPDGFYHGEVAAQIVAEMERGGGLITLQDLANYQPVPRTPLRGTYRGYEILGAPPPSSGGTALIETLNILEQLPLESNRATPANIHYMAEAMKRSYRDRARYLGDPSVNEFPAKLITKPYAKELAAQISADKATPSRKLAGDIELAPESEQTTHFSVVDKDRNAVSLTYTLENSYGSRVVVAGAGFLLNDEMNDFNWTPGRTYNDGRIGTEANVVRPGKRMLSSMSPTIVLRDGKPVLVTGSPGGRTIINTVACVVTNVIDFKMDIRAAVDAPRLHHQWFPDTIRLEPAWLKLRPKLLEELEAYGHQLAPTATQGDAHSIWIDPVTNELTGAADRRIHGSAIGY